jgi:hypothetical protein
MTKIVQDLDSAEIDTEELVRIYRQMQLFVRT